MSFDKFTLTVHAGPHDRRDCPARVTVPQALPDTLWGICTEGDEALWLQRLNGNEFAFIEKELRAGESRTYHFHPQTVGPDNAASLLLTHEKNSHITLMERDALITRYVYGRVPARPYFYPVSTPTGVVVTRWFPMRTDVPDEKHDHPHHRSVWIAFGEVNGTDNWSEEKGHGYTLHQSVDAVRNGVIAGQFATTSLWATAEKLPLLAQHLHVTAWATDGAARLLDFSIRLEATHGDVHFGDTKEGGILSVRVASAMDVPRGGRIENTYGGINEGETWGKAAHWCDYSGVVDGQYVGIAVLDHPHSFRYPTHWHVRDYGLMTANPFGYSAFTNGLKDGSYTLRAGESLTFRYRLITHTGDATAGRLAARYLDFVSPPKVTVASDTL